MSKLKNLRTRCFFDVSINGEIGERIIFELFNDICPKTCENFKSLCTGERGIGKTTNKPLHYKDVRFHRVIRGFMVQCGDFSAGNGKGGESIYGGTFPDENFHFKHDKPYLLSMANRGPNTNGSQFFITLAPTPHLDGVHVVFGHVLSGHETIEKIASVPVDKKARPEIDCFISNCGQLIPQIKEKADKLKKDKKKKDKKNKKHKKHSKKRQTTSGSSSESDSDESSSSSSSSDSGDEDDEEEGSYKKKPKNDTEQFKEPEIRSEVEEEEEEGEIRDKTPMNNPEKIVTTQKTREASPLPWAPKVYSAKFDPNEIPETPQNRFLSREPRPKPEENKDKDNKGDEESKDRKVKDKKKVDKIKGDDDRDGISKKHEDDKRRDRNDDKRRVSDDYSRKYSNDHYYRDDRRYNDRYRDDYRDGYRSRSSYYDRDDRRKLKGRGKFRFRRSVTPPHWRSKTKTLDEALGKVQPPPPVEREVAMRFDTIDRKSRRSSRRDSRSRSRSTDREERSSKRQRSRSRSRNRSKSRSRSRSRSPARKSKWSPLRDDRKSRSKSPKSRDRRHRSRSTSSSPERKSSFKRHREESSPSSKFELSSKFVKSSQEENDKDGSPSLRNRHNNEENNRRSLSLSN